ncbi:unnamed protein product, partial [Brachionus calyciflorus]
MSDEIKQQQQASLLEHGSAGNEDQGNDFCSGVL